MKAAIFDLDGTLVDSLGDIADASNHAMTTLGFHTLAVAEYRMMAGGGNTKLMTRLLKAVTGNDPDPELVSKGVQIKRAYENGPKGHVHTKVFPGALEMLKTLQDAGIQLGILSNKTETNVREVVIDHLPGIEWKYVAGAKDDMPLKPDPTAALKIIKDHMPGVEPADCIFVGDTDIDMKTGKAAGMTPVGVPWGFRSVEELQENGAETVVTTSREIADFVLTRKR